MLTAALVLSTAIASAGERRWSQKRVEIVVDESLREASESGPQAFARATQVWQSTAPGIPKLVLRAGSVGPLGYVPGGANQNTIRYAKKGSNEAAGTLAVTVVTYDKNSGDIYDADIVVNGKYHFRDLDAPLQIGKNGPFVYDLQSTLTHELGHFLGLPENYTDSQAVMYAYSQPGELKKRSPTESDVAALLALYEASTDTEEAGSTGCSIGRGSGVGWLGALLLVAGVALARRRRHAWTAGALALVAFPSLALSQDDVSQGELARAEARVTARSAELSGGLIVSTLTLSTQNCQGRAVHCAAIPSQITVLGGQVSELSQVVGHAAVPQEGEHVTVRLVSEQGTRLELTRHAPEQNHHQVERHDKWTQ